MTFVPIVTPVIIPSHECPVCGKEVPGRPVSCPHCGAELPSPSRTELLVLAGGLVVAVIGLLTILLIQMGD